MAPYHTPMSLLLRSRYKAFKVMAKCKSRKFKIVFKSEDRVVLLVILYAVDFSDLHKQIEEFKLSFVKETKRIETIEEVISDLSD